MFARLAALLSVALPLLAADAPLLLWYQQPASTWVEALPVGNGRMGAMVFGGVASERIQFNESTVWNGEPRSYAHVGAHQHLATIRKLLLDGKQKEAEQLAMREFMGVPMRQMAYQPFGDVELTFPGIDAAQIKDYKRSLDLDTAMAITEFTHAGTRFRREVFASWPAQAVVVRLSSSTPGKLSVVVGLTSPHAGATVTAGANGITLTGAPAASAIRFEARLVASAAGGKQLVDGNRVLIENATSATLILTGATNFKSFREVTADPAARNRETLAKLASQPYDRLRAAHLADHQRLFRRVTLSLPGTPAALLPTNKRIEQFATTPDPSLVALLFQYGRYLLIGSSREGGQPANLQGIWNDSLKPAWDSKYTVNINTEMNYWPAESTALPECHRPLFDALAEVAESGAITAKEHYQAGGWVLHHNFDLWRGTAPINASDHGIWQTGGAWLSLHLWEHYLYGGDKAFLRDKTYPLMKGAAEFFVDTLTDHPRYTGLVVGPSNSPEQGGLVMGPTMDHQIVRSLFGAVIAASRILDVDAAHRTRLTILRQRIAPNRVGQHGQLQEWLEDVDDPKNQHRHVSHLWGLHPGVEITPLGTPDLFAGAKKSLEFRGDAATGWSMGWKVNLWARLLDGEHAFTILKNLIQPAGPRKAGLYQNLFDAHPPFQIDGNFGATAGIAEMLVQSHDPRGRPGESNAVFDGEGAFVHLLPALPPALNQGRVSGLRARGGIDVMIEWKDGKLTSATLTGKRALPLTIRYAGREVKRFMAPGVPVVVTPAVMEKGS